MGTPTSAQLEERAASGFEEYRKVTYRSFLIAALGVISPAVVGLVQGHTSGKVPVPVTALAAVGLGLFLWLYSRLVQGSMRSGASRRDIVLSAVSAGLLSLMMLGSPVFCVIPVFWAATVALSVPGRRGQILLCLGTAAFGTVLVAVAVGLDRSPGWDLRHWYLVPAVFAGFAGLCWLLIFINLYQRRIWDLHQEAHAAREAQARLAVTEERLRFSRDLHDLLGHSLSLIAVKSELAIRLSEPDPARARAEMADVRQAARDALREVRSAVRGYRAVELDAELAGVRAVLEAAGVRCEAAAPPAALPPEVRSVLAWVIREGATNVIKHSEARHCAIALASHGGSVVLEMRNDGTGDAEGGAGSGLTGLAERVAVVGGDLTAARDGRDGFLLRAVVPLPAAGAERAGSTA
ncbi:MULTISPECIES: sensor histidine kinase [Thermomonosporaceae]|uniref:sensor histidine kinase n=1 Tax=Thermomonosporaceae TaxID=2012 RepID=UPI00255A86AE|nr:MULTISPECIES: sensor histidine kinase [Thermomonosporaceae]MDL4771053.1 sensor histidine kinase [Actinomadura xylanilytica]